MTELNIKGNDIGKDGAVAVAKALEVNASLTSIDLSRNVLQNDGAVAVANALRVNRSIKTLDLGYNGIGSEGAVALGKAINVNASMKKLNVLRNSIGAEGAQELVDAAPQQLQTLCGLEEGQTQADLSGKNLGSGGAMLVAWDLRTGFVSASMNSLK